MTILNDSQKDRLIDIMEQNEEHMVKYYMRRLEMEEKVALKKIDATTSSQRTKRIYYITGICTVLIITLLILFIRDSFFIPWLTFLTGIGSGMGLSKLNTNNIKEVKASSKSEGKDAEVD